MRTALDHLSDDIKTTRSVVKCRRYVFSVNFNLSLALIIVIGRTSAVTC